MITAEHLSKEFILNKKSNKNPPFTSLQKSEEHVIKAVDDISFYIPNGELVGLIGSNGAGKSTLIKLLSGILQSSAGIVRVFDKDPCRDREINSRRLGIVTASQTQLWKELPLIDSFDFVKSMYHITDTRYQDQLKSLCDTFDLNDSLRVTPKLLSLGQRMRAELVYAMLHQPELLLLDEPTVAIDICGKEKLCNLLKKSGKEYGTTVILVTNEIREIDNLCSRVMLMDHGKLIYDGDIVRFKNEYASVHTIRIELTDGLPDLQDLPIIKYMIEGKTMQITYDSKLIRKSTILAHILNQCKIRDIRTIEPDIEEIVLKLY